MTSSPGPEVSEHAGHFQGGRVQEWVRSALTQPTCSSSQASQRREKTPPPARCDRAMASRMYSNSRPVV